jgi:hypothetical protein
MSTVMEGMFLMGMLGMILVVGKSACGQVDRPLELDLNPRQKSAYHGH